MKHVFTKIKNADSVWQTGMMAALRMCGGGKLKKTSHGVAVFANNSTLINRFVTR